MNIGERVKNTIITIGTVAADIAIHDNYHGEYKAFTDSYAHDMILPISGYFMCKAMDGIWTGHKYMTAAFMFTGCTAMEFAQKLGWYHGTFDPKDILAYAAGTAIALGVDSLITKKNKSIDNALV